MPRYPGGKNGSGVWQRIINQMPPHDVYVEPFAGSAAVLRNKRPARCSFAIDSDPGTIARLNEAVLPPSTIVECGDGISRLAEFVDGPNVLIYCDPPYLPETRTKKRIYRHEMTREDHERLLDAIADAAAMVMISGYDSKLYRQKLAGWRRIRYRVMTRGGPRWECLWMNFDEPAELHDYRWLGETFRDRERIRRQQKRWAARLAKMDRLERLALMATIARFDEADSGQPAAGSRREAAPLAGNGDGRRGLHRRKWR